MTFYLDSVKTEDGVEPKKAVINLLLHSKRKIMKASTQLGTETMEKKKKQKVFYKLIYKCILRTWLHRERSIRGDTTRDRKSQG